MDAIAATQFGFAPALASALLHSLWQDALLGVAATLMLAALARSSAASRHNVAMLMLLAMVAVPASTFLGFWQRSALEINDGWLPAVSAPRMDGAGSFVQASSPWAVAAALLWLAGVGLMLLRRFGGWRLVAALDRRPFERLPADWQRRVDALRLALGISRGVAVRLSIDVAAPFTARLLRPVIWLPLSLLTRLPREQVEALLAHELAHIARMDWLWNSLQCVVEALLFFHPAAWWLGRRIRLEREHACDDRAVAACGDPIALAEALTHLERHRMPVPRLVLAAQGGSLMQRITRLLTAPPSRGRWGTRAGLVVLIAAGGLLVAQAAIGRYAKPSLHIEATTDGVLRPGDSREITANGVDKLRYYKASVDKDGRLVEVYREDGTPRPIDAHIRRWVAEIVRLSVPPAPPVPPPPPPPPQLPPMSPDDVAPAAAVAGMLPPPPQPPGIADSVEFQSLVRMVAADPGVVARLGTPVAMASNAVHGRIDMDAHEVTVTPSQGRTLLRADPTANGDADVRFELAGPKGRAMVHVDAQLTDGIWSMDRVDFVGPVR
jgi:beta-lactamase regulating signal transducer with metallopeptidase domain